LDGAVGHPWAATGGRVGTTLAYEIALREARRGLVNIYPAGEMAGVFLLARS
jgi:acetyl-CoA acetyltransferase